MGGVRGGEEVGGGVGEGETIPSRRRAKGKRGRGKKGRWWGRGEEGEVVGKRGRWWGRRGGGGRYGEEGEVVGGMGKKGRWWGGGVEGEGRILIMNWLS